MVNWQSRIGWPSLVLAAATLTGCEAIQGIFKAGVWVGVVVAVIVVALFAGAARLISRR